MDLFSMVMIAVALAMDAFAVSLCKGTAIRSPGIRDLLIVGVWFGGFQALMPVFGYLLGDSLYSYIAEVDHWIAFGLLLIIGLNMIRESISQKEEDVNGDLGIRIMFFLAVATSIDAFAVGITFAMEGSDIVLGAAIIGIVTLALSAVGMKVGALFGDLLGKKAELLGGIVLIAIGVKILLEHLGFF